MFYYQHNIHISLYFLCIVVDELSAFIIVVYSLKFKIKTPVAEFKRHSDIVAEKKLSFAERFVYKVQNCFEISA